MRIYKGILFISIALMAIACKPPADKIMEDFNEVASALQNTDAKIVGEDYLTLISLSILAMQKQNPQLATEADSIYLATTTAISFIDSVKNVLLEKDATGENTAVAMQLMNNNSTGDQLYHYLSNVYDYTIKTSTAKNKDSNKIYADVYEMPSPGTFIQKYFKATPTVGAITVLAKLKSDCVATAIAALNDIKSQLKYK